MSCAHSVIKWARYQFSLQWRCKSCQALAGPVLTEGRLLPLLDRLPDGSVDLPEGCLNDATRTRQPNRPSDRRRRSAAWEAVIADGWTPYPGQVLRVFDRGAIIDIGCGLPGFLGRRSETPPLQADDKVVVYATRKSKDTGRISLCLERRGSPQMRWGAVIADGCTPYEGEVLCITDYGIFVDIGCEAVGLVPSGSVVTESHREIQVGDKVTTYVAGKTKSSGKIQLSLEPRAVPLRSWSELVADGCTPLEGVIISKDNLDVGVFVDIGFECVGLLPRSQIVLHELEALELASKVIVYATEKRQKAGKVTLALMPSPVIKRQWGELIADGQTAYDGIVQSVTGFGAFVDIGFESSGLINAKDAQTQDLVPGSPVVVYVIWKTHESGRIGLALEPRQHPVQSIDTIKSDGQTPYTGKVLWQDNTGVYVDIGFERPGKLHAKGKHSALKNFSVGESVQVYVVRRCRVTGKLGFALQPSSKTLIPVEQLPADGQTPVYGIVEEVMDLGVFVDIGSDRCGLLSRRGEDNDSNALDELSVGAEVCVYILRRNPVNGKVNLGLSPSSFARLSVEDVLEGSHKGKALHGWVYQIQFGKAFVELGCQTGGVISLRSLPDRGRAWSVGDELSVLPTALDPLSGRLVLELPEELPITGRSEVTEAKLELETEPQH